MSTWAGLDIRDQKNGVSNPELMAIGRDQRSSQDFDLIIHVHIISLSQENDSDQWNGPGVGLPDSPCS